MEVRVRGAEIGDVAAIAAIHVAAWESTYRGVLPDAVIDERSLEVRARSWRARLSDPEPRTVAIVAEVEGVIRGFAVGGPSEYEDEDPAKVVNLNAVYIDLDWRRAGVALALNDGFLRAAAALGYELASGQIHDGNEASRRFFGKCGWKFDGTSRVVAGRAELRGHHPLTGLRDVQ